MQDLRHFVLWTAIALYSASIVTCIVSLARAWKKRAPWKGPASDAYLSPLAYLFLGAGFIVSALGNNAFWLRGMFFAAGLLQIVVFFVLRNRARKIQPPGEPRNVDSPSR